MKYYAKRHMVNAERVPLVKGKSVAVCLTSFLNKCSKIPDWKYGADGSVYIALERERLSAAPGDWVVIDGDIVKVVSNSKFASNFELVK